jgi:ribosomal protein S18 acetylase RimI-like enzyme
VRERSRKLANSHVMTPAPLSDAATLIREMRGSDREAVIGLVWQLNRLEGGLDPAVAPFAPDRDTSREAAIACLDSDAARARRCDGALLVAERVGEVVGFLCWLVETEEPFLRAELRRYGYVADLVVAEGHRGVGIGTLLLAEAERRTRERALRRLVIGVLNGNAPALRAYERFGFGALATHMMKALD